MCDYSLELYRTRPAREGERYMTTRFRSGTMGLASPSDDSLPVCVPCDTRMRLEGLPPMIQAKLGVGAVEDVTFMQFERQLFRDGLRFANGAEISLQQLPPGIPVVVTRLLENTPSPFRFAGAVASAVETT